MTNYDLFVKQQLENPEIKKEYDALEAEYEIIKQVLACRTEQNLTQQDLANRTGIKQSNISRFESGNSNPSLEFLQRIAEGLGKKLYIELK